MQSGDSWFILFESSDNLHFLQFAFNSSQGLFFDFPLKQLSSEAEARQAELIVSQYAKVIRSMEDGNPITDVRSFENRENQVINAELGFDKKSAASIAYLIFKNIFKVGENEKIAVTIDR